MSAWGSFREGPEMVGEAHADGQCFCTSCGLRSKLEDAFCRSCGTQLQDARRASRAEAEDSLSGAPDEHAGSTYSRLTGQIGERADSLAARLEGDWWGISRRSATAGVALGVACAVCLVVVVYAVLLLWGTFDSPLFPKNAGLAVFALLHGGTASAEVSQMQWFFGLEGSAWLDLPVTSFAVVPLALAFFASRPIARRMGAASWSFVAACAASYGLMVALLAALGTFSSETDGVVVRVYAAPVSAALWGVVLVGAGMAVGVATIPGSRVGGRSRLFARWPNLLGPGAKARAGQALKGALLAAGVGMLPASFFALLDIATCGFDGLTGQASGSFSGYEGSCEGRGALSMFLPTVVGGAWLLGHGLPVGFKSGSDLGNLPFFGENLSELPSRVSLFGNWPLGGEYYLLIMTTALGILIGGAVSARDALAQNRFLQGASVSIPYVAIAILVNSLVGITFEMTLAGSDLDLVLRVPLAWMLALLVATAVLGGLGGIIAGHERISVLQSRLPSLDFGLLRRAWGRVR